MRLLGVIGLLSLFCIDHFWVCRALLTQSPTPTFLKEPSGPTVIFEHGETSSVTTTMVCKVSNLQPGQTVSWLKGMDDTIISDNHTVRTEHVIHVVDNDRYSIYGDETRGEYNLKIEMVSYRTAAFDSGRYGCAVFYDDSISRAPVIRSRDVQQHIFVVPRMMYPQCFVVNANVTLSNDIIEGEAVTLICQSDIGYPTVTMAWYQGNPSSIITHDALVNDSLAFIRYVWTPTVNDGSVIFKCALDHPAFTISGGQRLRTCSVGPFNIRQRTTAEYGDYISEEETSSTTSDSGNDLDDIHTTEKTATTSEIKRQQYLPSSEKCSASIIGGTFIGGLMLGTAITIISGGAYITLRRWKVDKPGERNTTSVIAAGGNANAIEMERTCRHQNDTEYEDILEIVLGAHYETLTDRPQTVYTSLQ